MTFESLWPSLRQTIIDEIQADFTGLGYIDAFYPVQRILKLKRAKLARIMNDNGEVWETADIPLYYRELRKGNPDAIIDPEQPPPAQVVRAIMFLKQKSLPCSLLGEWQVLPAVEVFHPSL